MFSLSPSVLSYAQVGLRKYSSESIPDLSVSISAMTGPVYVVERLMGQGSIFILISDTSRFTMSTTGVISCGTAMNPTNTETLLVVEQKADLSVAVARTILFNGLTPQLTISPVYTVVNEPFQLTVSGSTTNAVIDAASSDGTPLSVTNNTISGTFASLGTRLVTVINEDFSTVNVPFQSDAVAVTAVAFQVGQLDFSKPINSNMVSVIF